MIIGTEAEYQSNAGSTQDTPYLALTGELWGVLCEYLWQNWPRYNGTALYITCYIIVMIEKIMWNGGISGAYALGLPRYFLHSLLCRHIPYYHPGVGSAGNSTYQQNYPPELFVSFCFAMHRPVLIRFGSHPRAAFLRFSGRSLTEGGGRIRFGSDYDPSMCNSTQCFSKLCSF